MTPSKELKDALTAARELVLALLAADSEDESTESPSIVLLASLTVKANRQMAATAATKAIAAAEADDEKQKPDRDTQRTLLKDRLAAEDPDSTDSPAVEPWELIEHVLNGAQVSRRTRYNLACYYTTLGRLSEVHRDKVFKLALAALEFALVGGDLAEWAKKDPSLKALRDKCPKEFEALVGRHTAAAHEEESEEAAAPAAPATTPAATRIDILPLLLKLSAEVGASEVKPGGEKNPFDYLIQGKEKDVLVRRSWSPRLTEIEALFDAAEAWQRSNPRLVIAVGGPYAGPTELRREKLLIEIVPLAAGK